jgi:hypothetical protein
MGYTLTDLNRFLDELTYILNGSTKELNSAVVGEDWFFILGLMDMRGPAVPLQYIVRCALRRKYLTNSQLLNGASCSLTTSRHNTFF